MKKTVFAALAALVLAAGAFAADFPSYLNVSGTKAQWQAFKVSLNSGAVVRCSNGNITVR